MAHNSLSKLDIFPKIESCFTRSTVAGATVSVFTYVIITLLLISEIFHYFNTDIIYKYSVDTVFDKKLKINVDITVATPCSNIGADVMDSSNKHSLYAYEKLHETPAKYEPEKADQERWQKLKRLNHLMRQAHHEIHKWMWKPKGLPPKPRRYEHPEDSLVIYGKKSNGLDSCRIHGTMVVNKLSGNFHVAAGKYLPLPVGHAHVSLIESEKLVNFSHRIETLSFGDEIPHMFNTLDGVEKITQSSNQLYQYYLKVVLTNVQTSAYRAEAYQYSVTERELVVDHQQGKHGIPGIYFKYEIDGLRIDVLDDGMPVWKFLVRLCALVGGIIELAFFLNRLATFICDWWARRMAVGHDKPLLT